MMCWESVKIMKKFRNIILTVLFLMVVVTVGYLLIKFIIEAARLFLELPVELSTTMLATATTIIVSVISITLGKYYERKRKIEFELRENKIPIYQGFMKFSSRLFLGTKAGQEEIDQEEMVRYFNDFTYDLIIWGSDDVINSWNEFREQAIKHSKKSDPEESEKSNPLDSMLSYEKLLLAIRKDTGHKNKNIEKGTLLRMFINDYDDYKEK